MGEVMELLAEARHEMTIFNRPSKRTSLRMIEALTTAQAEIEAMRAWRDAVDDALVQHMTTAGSFPDARAAVRWLIEREQHMALDPAISADARKLIDAEAEAQRARVAELEGALRSLENAACMVGQWRSTIMCRFDGKLDWGQWNSLNDSFDRLEEKRGNSRAALSGSQP